MSSVTLNSSTAQTRFIQQLKTKAASGDLKALLLWGKLQAQGDKGLAKNPKGAFQAFEAAVEKGDSTTLGNVARWNLMRCCLIGFGTEKDLVKAQKIISGMNFNLPVPLQAHPLAACLYFTPANMKDFFVVFHGAEKGLQLFKVWCKQLSATPKPSDKKKFCQRFSKAIDKKEFSPPNCTGCGISHVGKIDKINKQDALSDAEKTAQIAQIFRKCSGCHFAYYCDAACQKLHWPQHKPVCQIPTSDASDLD